MAQWLTNPSIHKVVGLIPGLAQRVKVLVWAKGSGGLSMMWCLLGSVPLVIYKWWGQTTAVIS